ncbi:AfsR/SARP family transcriptional regulator [Micromonospora auratinigra]|uniref:DNA-binding transcriptional activator of the SARP family n=1 Tax=Micromonospora auratinigra TaxID=261654 RepID=A0A1A8ZPT1_9ACTN|nr:BTAD domain-containing putative transcriptional regulator [Micromonospora auratinigra]SBT45831.1 DNA-binding transcriptional activator of the SARP family [Micromonospora auratinigra]
MQLRVLGELQVRAGDRPLDLGPTKQRLVLAALAVDAGRAVPVEALIDRVWDTAPPTEARGVLHTYLTRIRRVLAGAGSGDGPAVTVTRRSGGYLLEATPDQVDLLRLGKLRDEAATLPPRDPRRAQMLRDAVELWTGEPLDGLPGSWASRVREGLRQELLGVLLDWADSDLEQGRSGHVADRLRRALERDPLAEPLALRLIRALHLNGRRAEALDQFTRTRMLLADELGVDPGPELQALHREILRGQLPVPAGPPRAEPVPVEASPAGGEALPPPTAPGCQLPADLPDHVGCESEMSLALTVLGEPQKSTKALPPMIVSGPGGVGKTSFTLRLAHLLRAAYPDGQIFVSLDGQGDDPGHALNRVLRALGVADLHGLPTLADKLSQYRSALSRRRLLIVVDGATSAEQVRPLTPGAPGVALIVSSRSRLTTIPGACHLELPLLRREESIILLGRIVGAEKVRAEREAVDGLVDMCEGLPLALRIVGARLAARPHRRVARLTERIRDERGRLDEMEADGLAVRASIAIGYEALDPAAARAFRLLGFLGGPDFAEWVVAALTGEGVDRAEELLEQLIDARLVVVMENPAGRYVRYRMHDLVRLYACERAVEEETTAALHAAVGRALAAATQLSGRHGEPSPYALAPLYRQAPDAMDAQWRPASTDPDPVRPDWIDVEAPFLIAAVERAAALGLDVAACALADALVVALFATGSDFTGWGRTHSAALEAARAAGNRVAEAVVECGIALLRYREDRFAEALVHYPAAVALFDAAGHVHGAAAARNGFGTVLRELGRHREAVPLLTAAADTLDRLGDENGAAHARYGLGYCHRELGDDEPAVDWLTQANDRYRRLGHWRGEALTTRGIGLVHRARGDLDEAERWCARAHRLAVEHGDEYTACYTVQALAKIWLRSDRAELAGGPLASSLAICRQRRDRFGVALISRTIGELQLAVGDLDAALETLTGAHAAWRELGHDLGQARTLRDIGAVQARRGDQGATHRAWELASATFAALGTREQAEVEQWHRHWGCGCAAGLGAPDGLAATRG